MSFSVVRASCTRSPSRLYRALSSERPGKILDGQIANALDVGIGDAALRGKPAHHEILAHGERQRVEYVALRRLIGRLAQRARKPIEQRRLQRAGSQGGASSHRELVSNESMPRVIIGSFIGRGALQPS